MGDSPDGPRGNPVLLPKLAHDPDNLMLVCDEHHRVIDREMVDAHSVDVLREMKRRHEARILAEALRTRVLQGPGETLPRLRQASAERAASGPAMEAPFDDLARLVGKAAHRVIDAQVSSVQVATGSEKATFETIAAAALGAGLSRWERAVKVLDQATDASE